MSKPLYPFQGLKHHRFPDKAHERANTFPDIDGSLTPLDNRPFLVDAQKIMLSKAIRRLPEKTQVFTDTLNQHIRNRLTHTMEVASLAVAMAENLGLNSDLCHAMALGHDLGHVPFGHTGEEFIQEHYGINFRHENFGIVICQKIERKGKGLNLTRQTLQGILNHSRGAGELHLNTDNIPMEADLVMYADKIAYVFADINDIFQHSGKLKIEGYPEIVKMLKSFGRTQRERVTTCAQALCYESVKCDAISFQSSSETAYLFAELKRQMYNIYNLCNRINSKKILHVVAELLWDYFHDDELGLLFLCLMTDSEVMHLYRTCKLNDESIKLYGAYEILPFIKGRFEEFNIEDPKID